MLSVMYLYAMHVLTLTNAEKCDGTVCLKVHIHVMLVNKNNYGKYWSGGEGAHSWLFNLFLKSFFSQICLKEKSVPLPPEP